MMEDWREKLVDLALRRFDHATMTDLQLIAREAIAHRIGQAVRVEALESALSDLLDAANPHTDEDFAKYEDAAKHAELVLRGGEPEGERKNPADLD